MLKSHIDTVFQTLGRHPIHPFPARMAPGIALDALREYKSPIRVLDPMAGSGTVLAVARINGHRAFGIDLDPLAVLLATVWTRSIDPEEVSDMADKVLTYAKSKFDSISAGKAYPAATDTDTETRTFVRFWFDNEARRQLTALSNEIRQVHNHAVRDVLWCGFSRLIITKTAGASLAMDLSHSRPHKAFKRAPVKPFSRFLSAVQKVVANCPHKGRSRIGPKTVVKQGDTRRLDIRAGSIDLVLTSPPYLNAIDYIRCSKFSLIWMGYTINDLRDIRGTSVGAEASLDDALHDSWIQLLITELNLDPALSKRSHALLSRYVWDMRQTLAEVARVLRPKGRAVFVVGDSTIRGTFVRNSRVIEAAADAEGLELKSRYSRDLPPNRRYLPPPKLVGVMASMDTRMKREVILEFNKPAT